PLLRVAAVGRADAGTENLRDHLVGNRVGLQPPHGAAGFDRFEQVRHGRAPRLRAQHTTNLAGVRGCRLNSDKGAARGAGPGCAFPRDRIAAYVATFFFPTRGYHRRPAIVLEGRLQDMAKPTKLNPAFEAAVRRMLTPHPQPKPALKAKEKTKKTARK